MLAIETTNDYDEVVIDVFVSDSDLIGIRRTIRIEKLADKVSDMAGMECTGFVRTQVSSSSWAFAKAGYLLRCRDLIRGNNTASHVRTVVEAVLESLKEERV